MLDRAHQLSGLEYLGDAVRFATQIHALIPKCPLLENFSPAEVRLLAHFMEVYRAEPGMEIIREGEGGDFMMMLIEGKVDVHKRDRWNTPQPIAQVEAGRTLGEMSMIDGEPRFATCVALERTLIAVLDRENLAHIIVDPAALKMLPRDMARRYRVFPVAVDRQQRKFIVALADTNNIVAIDQLRAHLKGDYEIELRLAGDSEIERAIEHYYGHEFSIDGILKEADEIAGEVEDASVLDAALIAAAQAVEHYEITRYGTLIAWAKELGRSDCAAVLTKNLDEEKATDKKLTALAEAKVNRKAAS
jgi:CRP-like cAMP-binding protein